MIEYKATVSNIEIPEIQGYKKQFSLNIPRGDNNKKEDTPVYNTEQVVEKPIVEEVITPTINEWSDIRAIIKKNEGFMDTAKSKFNEPSATVGYGFFDRLPDGTKITPGMRISRAQADRQLDIALDKLSTRVRESLNKYNIKTSPEQFNILLDLGYHGGAGLVDKLLKESNGDTTKIGSLLLHYATTAKYGDTTITRGLKNRALRRSEGWNKYVLKGKNGLKVPKFQKGGISPKVIYNALTGIRQKIADSKWGPRVAQELGIKPKEITLSDGTKTTVTGGFGILGPDMLANPNKTVAGTTRVITKASPALKNIIEKIRLYRATGTSGKFTPSIDGTKEFTGQWFTNNPQKPQIYASKTTKNAKLSGEKNPIELQYVDIPKSEIEKYKAENILKGRTDVEFEPTEDFLIPLDYPRNRIPLEGYTGNLLQDIKLKLPKISSKRNLNSEMAMRGREDEEFGKWSAENVSGWAGLTNKQKIKFLDRTYDGRYALNVWDAFERQNATGDARVKFMLSHPVKSLEALTQTSPDTFATGTWTTLSDELSSASRSFAKKYADDFDRNWKIGVQYDAKLSSGTLGETEGSIIGRGFESGDKPIKLAFSENDTSPLARITASHEMGHATGNYNDPYIYNYLKEANIVDWDRVSPYFKDADKGEIGQHLSEIPNYLGYKWDSVHNSYVDAFGNLRKINATQINNYKAFATKNGFPQNKSILGNIKNMKEFVKFLNEHPFAVTLPVAGIGGAAAIEQNKKPNSN